MTASALTTLDLHRLDRACALIRDGFGHPPYLVGTAGIGEKGQTYRDVDVRLILHDDEFDELFGDSPKLWEAVCVGLTSWLVLQTGLPVDFQIQRMTEANENFHGPRNPLGVRREYAGGGDATPFHAKEHA
jgi:hypothetical protein